MRFCLAPSTLTALQLVSAMFHEDVGNNRTARGVVRTSTTDCREAVVSSHRKRIASSLEAASVRIEPCLRWT